MFTTLNNFLIHNEVFSYGYFGGILLFAALSIGTALGLPRQVAALSASALFGIKLGFVIATTATILGCILTVITCRYLLANWVHKQFPEKTTVIHDFLSDNTFLKALIIRILPLGSNFITNIVAGATRIPFKSYVLGSAIGFIPQMVIFSLAGGGIKLAAEQEYHIALTLTFLAALLILGLWFSNKAKKKLSNR